MSYIFDADFELYNQPYSVARPCCPKSRGLNIMWHQLPSIVAIKLVGSAQKQWLPDGNVQRSTDSCTPPPRRQLNPSVTTPHKIYRLVVNERNRYGRRRCASRPSSVSSDSGLGISPPKRSNSLWASAGMMRIEIDAYSLLMILHQWNGITVSRIISTHTHLHASLPTFYTCCPYSTSVISVVRYVAEVRLENNAVIFPRTLTI